MRNFYVFLAMAILLAIFLMTVIVVQHLVDVSASANQAFMAVMILILALPIVVAVESVRKSGRNSSPAPVPASDDQHPSDHEQLNSSPKSKVVEDHTAPIQNQQHHEADDEESARRQEAIDPPSVTGTPRLRVSCSSSAKQCLRKLADEIRQMPPRGEDHTVLQALVSLDLWIVFFATTAGLGSGLMVVDNLGQMGSSLGYSQSNIATFVSLVSIWNFFGRVGFGFVSEIFLQKHGAPRPVFLALVLGILAVGHLYLAFAWPGAFYIGSILVGMCFGAQMPVMFAIISEIFGLKYFGTLYNVGILASPLGTYLLSVKTAGHLYDVEAAKQPQNGTSSSSSHDLLCYGPQCFRNSLLIMAAVCVFGCLISVFLAFRTRHYYRSIRSAMKQNL
ncbi:uncharacterized protein LOC112346354 [Selaginella moellendorffii]|uniref:uncharacterized protein LOC112346354 n=1 Tax=Selaginella moellendorffii TaxID=88036 RepID=UPI000D1CB31F|nr:uncharacterized protein LOC112346354 [Selaginella moellendorffii]|eukprot:XP_024530874.1 uncharacterized protein LOC112346354 [Selaginella moellendorffii]